MKPVRTAFTNMLFKLEGGTDENDLPCEKTHDGDEKDVLVTTWEVTPQEAQEIVKGKRIELVVWGEEHPPVALRIEEAE
jgi:hypothetical protein